MTIRNFPAVTLQHDKKDFYLYEKISVGNPLATL